MSWKAPVAGATSQALLANTLAPAAGISVGQTLTANANGSLNSDPAVTGAAIGLFFFVGDRILVRQDAAPKNGIYVITSLGSAGSKWVLTRAIDAASATSMPTGTTVYSVGDGALFSSNLPGGQPGCVFLNSTVDIFGSNVNAAALSIFGPTRALGSILAKKPVVNVYLAGSTWATPTDCLYIEVECVGGGGGGGGSATTAAGEGANAAGGGGGGYSRKLLLVSALSGNYTVTVGAAGAAGAAGNNAGGTGGLSSFAGAGITTVQGNGGTGGAGGLNSATTASSVGGTGGTGTGGDVTAQGDDGGNGRVLAGSPVGSGDGGGSMFGGRARQGLTASGGGGSANGGGGSGANAGASVAARAGGAGGAGIVIVREYYGP